MPTLPNIFQFQVDLPVVVGATVVVVVVDVVVFGVVVVGVVVVCVVVVGVVVVGVVGVVVVGFVVVGFVNAGVFVGIMVFDVVGGVGQLVVDILLVTLVIDFVGFNDTRLVVCSPVINVLPTVVSAQRVGTVVDDFVPCSVALVCVIVADIGIDVVR